jgi:hypothetical protein
MPGLMIEDGAPRLIEYNVRFGDPEAQVLLMRLGGQALDLIQACAEGRLGDVAVHWAEDHALTVVLAARGYPGAVEKGAGIGGLDALPETSEAMVFHAGTAERDGQVVASGGRVLNVTARGASLQEARDRAYAMVDRSTRRGSSAAATSGGGRCERTGWERHARPVPLHRFGSPARTIRRRPEPSGAARPPPCPRQVDPGSVEVGRLRRTPAAISISPGLDPVGLDADPRRDRAHAGEHRPPTSRRRGPRPRGPTPRPPEPPQIALTRAPCPWPPPCHAAGR